MGCQCLIGPHLRNDISNQDLLTHCSTGIPVHNRICGWKATRYQIHLSHEDSGIVRFLQSDTIKRARRETHTLGAINEGVRGRSLLVFY